MKQLFIQLSVTIALLSVFSFHCMGADKYTLEYKLEKGKTYKQSSVAESTIKMNAMGQDMEVSMKMGMNALYDVKEITGDGYDVHFTYQKIKMDLTGPVSISIDSDAPDSAIDKGVGEVFKSLTETPLDIHLTKQGKVTSVEGADKLAEKLNNLSNPQLKQILSQQFSEKAIQTTIEKMSPVFPDKPVSIGDSWDVNTNINTNGFDLISKMTLTLREVKDKVATIEFAGTLATPEGGSTFKVNGMDAKMTMTGDQAGRTQVSMKTGWITHSETTVNSKQNIEVMGQTIVQDMVVKVSVTGE
jgi:hypothetical protein